MEEIAAFASSLSRISRRNYRYIVQSFLRDIGKDLKSLEKKDIDLWISKKEISRRTMKTYLYVLSRFFRYVEREDLSKHCRDRAKEIRMSSPIPRVDEDLLRRMEELKRRISEMEGEKAAIIALLLSTGMRLSEVLSLRINDIDLKRRMIRVIGKGGKERIVYMTSWCAEIVSKYVKGANNDRIFRVSARTVQRWVKGLLGVSPHGIRHAFAVMYLARGGNVRALQKILGHSKLSTTEVYLDIARSLVEEDFRRTMDHP
ncbi:MAG: tyrosine-type recombinase/integrase [Candidatus Methanodesulfokora washburnensis]